MACEGCSEGTTLHQAVDPHRLSVNSRGGDTTKAKVGLNGGLTLEDIMQNIRGDIKLPKRPKRDSTYYLGRFNTLAAGIRG